ncbi:hypothetical protein [Botrimarina mediterranea]|uniref:hypothetical protein n=1 Tax=Botrimarina mediterranea TaxID=2528022 RepID=UPI00118D53F2|nr:Chromosome partition protein Smc [Planctomycetes bacterium K2D]
MDPRGPAADELRQTADSAREALGQLREGLLTSAATRCGEVSDLGARATQLVEELAAKIADELASDIARQHELATDALRVEIDRERDALVAEGATLAAEREQLAADREQLAAESDKLATERQAWETERTEWESVRKEIEAELSAMEHRLVQQAQSLQREREAGPSNGELLTQLQEANDARLAAEENLAAAEKGFAASKQELADAQTQIAQLSETLEESTNALSATAELGDELEALRGKFEMALADLQSHRERVAELEQEIANRPALDLDDSEEIQRLRHERDDLARRLEEANEFADPSQEMEDLRARFQMAVEDLRALKTENADLRDQLASGGGGGAMTGGGDGNDWESQKRRLLAALESEGEGQIDAPRREERAAIAGTIQITDAVVAEKDAEIQRLKQQLESIEDVEPTAAAIDAAVLDNDEVIRAERERIAKLEQEWQEKLRSAELELSVERAKIARAQSELAEQQMELETLRAASGNGLAPGEARRNWFNKLGLGNDGKPT